MVIRHAPTSRTAPEDVVAARGKGVVKQYNVYRNNVTVSLIDALAAIYPAVQRITGVEFFRAMGALSLGSAGLLSTSEQLLSTSEQYLYRSVSASQGDTQHCSGPPFLTQARYLRAFQCINAGFQIHATSQIQMRLLLVLLDIRASSSRTSQISGGK
jgi:Putative DNA-binding domain